MNPSELDNQLEELEIRLERLRSLYEQYFLGIEKLEPSVARKDVERRFFLLRREQIRNTARRFKLQTLFQRYNTFQQYWQRICREIENGTYRRHLARAERIVNSSDLLTIAARRRAGRFRRLPSDESDTASDSSIPPGTGSIAPSEVPPAAATSTPPQTQSRPARPPLDSLELELEMALFGHALTNVNAEPAANPAPPRARTIPPPLPPRRRPPVQPPETPPARPALPAPAETAASRKGGLTEERVRELHSRLIDEKRANNERTNVSLDKLSRSLREAEAQLRQKHGNRMIDFDVVVKNGKVVVKPIVRRR